MASTKTRALACTALGALALALGACSTTDEARHAGDAPALRKDPSPAMENLYARAADKRNRRALVWDTNLRMIHDDVARAWHADAPSRLTPVTKPY